MIPDLAKIHARFMASVAPIALEKLLELALQGKISPEEFDARLAKNCVESADAMLEAWQARWPSAAPAATNHICGNPGGRGGRGGDPMPPHECGPLRAGGGTGGGEYTGPQAGPGSRASEPITIRLCTPATSAE